MKWKEKINLELQPEMAQALPLIDKAHEDASIPRDAVVTSANDGKHGKNSLHPKGLAVDLRTKDLTSQQIGELSDALRVRLNGSKKGQLPFQVVVETDADGITHIHVEYDPS